MKNGAGHWMQATTGSWRQPLLSTIEYPWQHSATVARTRRGGVLGLWPALFRHRRLSRASERLSPLLPGTRSHPRCLEWTAAIAVCAQSALATIATNARHPTQHGLSESLQRRFSVGSQILLRRNLVPRVSVSASTVRIQSIQTTHGPMEAFGASHAAYSTQHWSPTLSLRVPSASNPSSKQEQLSFLKRTLLEGAVIEACRDAVGRRGGIVEGHAIVCCAGAAECALGGVDARGLWLDGGGVGRDVVTSLVQMCFNQSHGVANTASTVLPFAERRPPSGGSIGSSSSSSSSGSGSGISGGGGGPEAVPRHVALSLPRGCGAERTDAVALFAALCCAAAVHCVSVFTSTPLAARTREDLAARFRLRIAHRFTVVTAIAESGPGCDTLGFTLRWREPPTTATPPTTTAPPPTTTATTVTTTTATATATATVDDESESDSGIGSCAPSASSEECASNADSEAPSASASTFTFTLRFVDASHGIPRMVSVARSLARSAVTSKAVQKVQLATLDSLLKPRCGDPDLLYVFGGGIRNPTESTPFSLDAYPPWELRLTEVWYDMFFGDPGRHIGGDGVPTSQDFLKGLRLYAKCERRVGK
ncbi:hypothetical protein BC830DRAFT_1085700 [Chytriomyces sp. MP71]|nr:hypothetical protein BC830DRAFT_1085700 [Chytriomyces sp. MP71]